MAADSWTIRLARVFVLLVVVGLGVAASSLIAAHLVGRQFAQLLATKNPPPLADPTTALIDVDFYEATGIRLDELRTFLQDAAARDHLDVYPAHLTFLNGAKVALVDAPVEILWHAGHDRLTVGASGVLRIMLRPDILEGLRFRVPPGYGHVKQHTLPLGDAYEPYERPAVAGTGRFVANDYDIQIELWRQLARQKAARQGLTPALWRDQIRRTRCDWTPPPSDGSPSLSTEEIFARRRDAVVVIGHLMPDGDVVHAAGVIVDPRGIIATARHVLDKPEALARGVMTAAGRTYAVQEILAADAAADTALLRIDAAGLPYAPVSHGDREGSRLTILSHPSAEFYSITDGILRRYQTAVVGGRQAVQMAVTADFTDGASGGPVFNARGELAGIVSFRRRTSSDETARIAAPAHAVRALGNSAP